MGRAKVGPITLEQPTDVTPQVVKLQKNASHCLYDHTDHVFETASGTLTIICSCVRLMIRLLLFRLTSPVADLSELKTEIPFFWHMVRTEPKKGRTLLMMDFFHFVSEYLRQKYISGASQVQLYIFVVFEKLDINRAIV